MCYVCQILNIGIIDYYYQGKKERSGSQGGRNLESGMSDVCISVDVCQHAVRGTIGSHYWYRMIMLTSQMGHHTHTDAFYVHK